MKKTLIFLILLFPVLVIAGSDFDIKLAKAALERTKSDVVYNGKYVKLKYPMGDVPPNIGVCTDVVIRSYRTLNIDLQKEVHVDMKKNFHLYPKIWGLKRPDRNIDHRRVPNLRVFFKRFGKALKVTKKGKDYKPGDLVTWNVASWYNKRASLPHIGIVSDQKVSGTSRYKIVHNIGSGPEIEDMLFDYAITGHYRYQPKR